MTLGKIEIEEAALHFHSDFPAGMVGIKVTKDVVKNISIAYSPGVAAPCIEINLDPVNAKKYTNIQNSIAIISNGTAVLGLGKLGALASKPVMQGKSALFKVLAGIDCVDIEIEERDPSKLVSHIEAIATTFGGINLEDIAAPECFEVENSLKKSLKIPVFHDDQHGTAIVVSAAFINWCKLREKKPEGIKLVCLGAGAAGIACAKMLRSLGVTNILMFDSKGIINTDRTDLTEQKKDFITDTNIKLQEALEGADMFLGTSVGNSVTAEMIKGMNTNPLILALANPVPEIYPHEVHAVREDAIICTGRSDLENQVNNVLCFPYVFRVALDHDLEINDHLKITVANSIADFARHSLDFGPKSIVPRTNDESIRYVMPGLIMSNLVSQINIAEYSRNMVARRLISHAHTVFSMNQNGLLHYLKLSHNDEFTNKNKQIESILAAWGYTAAHDRMISPIDKGRIYSSSIYIVVAEGRYTLIYSGNDSAILQKLKTGLATHLCVQTSGYPNLDDVICVIENHDTNPICYYNQESPADELALLSIICSNIYINAAG